MGRVKTDATAAAAAAKAKAAAGKKEEEEKKTNEAEKKTNEVAKKTNEAEKPEEDKPEDPPIVKQLKEIDDKYLELEKEYEREVQKLLNEYTKRQQPLLEERKTFLTAAQEDGPVTGTPTLSGFWLKAMQNHPAFEDVIQEYDEPALEFLTDIERTQNEEDNSKGFKLTFHFLENPYFENTELTKEYITDESNPYCGEIEVKEIKATVINWKAGKNVTVEKVAKKVKGGGAKKQKQKGKEKEEARPSFFRDFFRSLKEGVELPEDAKMQVRGMLEDDDEDDDENDEELLEYLMDNDHELGTALRDNIVPWAVRWYTGEAAPDMEGVPVDEESEEEDFSDDEESSSEDDAPKGRGRGGPKASAKKAIKPKGSPGSGPADGKPQEECKQQ